MIVPRYYENLSVLHENTMPARAYYIPASRRMDNLVEHREESDRMQLLNGTWKFQYFNSIYDIQDSFFEKNYDTENFDEIQVPSVWQMAGYGPKITYAGKAVKLHKQTLNETITAVRSVNYVPDKIY